MAWQTSRRSRAYPIIREVQPQPVGYLLGLQCLRNPAAICPTVACPRPPCAVWGVCVFGRGKARNRRTRDFLLRSTSRLTVPGSRPAGGRWRGSNRPDAEWMRPPGSGSADVLVCPWWNDTSPPGVSRSFPWRASAVAPRCAFRDADRVRGLGEVHAFLVQQAHVLARRLAHSFLVGSTPFVQR